MCELFRNTAHVAATQIPCVCNLDEVSDQACALPSQADAQERGLRFASRSSLRKDALGLRPARAYNSWLCAWPIDHVWGREACHWFVQSIMRA